MSYVAVSGSREAVPAEPVIAKASALDIPRITGGGRAGAASKPRTKSAHKRIKTKGGGSSPPSEGKTVPLVAWLVGAAAVVVVGGVILSRRSS